MVAVADLFLCIDINPDRFHRSRASLRRPQWDSLRDGLNSQTWPRFNAFMTPIRANIVGLESALPAAIGHAAAALSSLSSPRATILAASSGNVRCNAFASSHGPHNQTSRSSPLLRQDLRRAGGLRVPTPRASHGEREVRRRP